MIAADTSTWSGFLGGSSGQDVDLLDRALKDRQLLMPPVVLAELLSSPGLNREVVDLLLQIPLIELEDGYWQRTGLLRSCVLAKRRKARLGGAMIAQSCLDRGVPLLTRDSDFRAFVVASELDLVLIVPGQ